MDQVKEDNRIVVKSTNSSDEIIQSMALSSPDPEQMKELINQLSMQSKKIVLTQISFFK